MKAYLFEERRNGKDYIFAKFDNNSGECFPCHGMYNGYNKTKHNKNDYFSEAPVELVSPDISSFYIPAIRSFQIATGAFFLAQ